MLGREHHIAARLDRLPMSRGLWKLVVLISLGAAFELYDIFLSTYITPGLTASGMFTNRAATFFAINSVGFFISCNFAGMFVGCVGFGYVADRWGRRSIFVFSLLWYSICTAIMAFQTTALGVDLWRFIAGIGVGLEQVTIDTFLPEIVPPQSRGKAFAFYQFVEFCSVPIVALLGWLLVPLHPLGLDGWRWVALIGSLGAMVVWWLRRGLPESPRWLAAHGREDEADRVLTELEARAVRDTGLPLPEPTPRAPEAPLGDGAFNGGAFRELLRPPYARRTLVLSVFNLMQTVAFYGFGSWVPTLLIAKGILVTTSQMYAFIIAIANPIGPLLGMLVADRKERKWQIVSAGIAIGVFATLFANQANQALVIVFGVGVTLSNNWMSFAFHNYQGELFPTRVRARAVGFVYSWSRVSATFASLMINFLLVRGGAPAVAAFIAAAMLVMTVTIGGFGPKTRSLTLEEISR
jgi:putative MFS transporter